MDEECRDAQGDGMPEEGEHQRQEEDAGRSENGERPEAESQEEEEQPKENESCQSGQPEEGAIDEEEQDDNDAVNREGEHEEVGHDEEEQPKENEACQSGQPEEGATDEEEQDDNDAVNREGEHEEVGHDEESSAAEEARPEEELQGQVKHVGKPPGTFRQTNEETADDDLYSHMSTKVDVRDVDALRQAIADVRSDANGVSRKSWVVVGHVDNSPNLVELKAVASSEEANLEDFRQLLEDDQVMYALVRTTTTVDMSATVRFVYVHWIGEQVPFVKRGRYGVVHGSVEAYFNPYHVVIETGNRDELTEEELVKLLEEKSMTVSRVVETPSDKRHERGFTQHQQKRKTPIGQPKAVVPAGNQVEVTPELNEAIGQVRNDSSDVAWLLAEYEGNNIRKPLVMVSKGSGGIDAMKECLNNERVQYGLLRTSDTYDDIKTVKFVYIYWIGEGVKPMMKGKVYANAGAVEQIFSPIHVSLSFTNVEEITEEIVKDKVSSSSGSKSFVK